MVLFYSTFPSQQRGDDASRSGQTNDRSIPVLNEVIKLRNNVKNCLNTVGTAFITSMDIIVNRVNLFNISISCLAC